ncbi:MAG: divalent-cation tolerance protein CutA [Candidatus Hydrothermarchaeota archaeon]
MYITASSEEEAKKISEILLNERLAACANIFPIKSLYWWEGKITEDEEYGILIKTRKNLLEKIEKKVKEIHSYKVPCIISMSITSGSKDYLEWIDKETSK